MLAEKKRILAYLFMDGADKKIFGYLLKNMSNNHALGTEVSRGCGDCFADNDVVLRGSTEED